MTWKVGQKVVCDRPENQLSDCFIRTVDASESIIIFCPATNTVICGQRHNLERLGWRIDYQTTDSN